MGSVDQIVRDGRSNSPVVGPTKAGCALCVGLTGIVMFSRHKLAGPLPNANRT
jgi:hypothetical protein